MKEWPRIAIGFLALFGLLLQAIPVNANIPGGGTGAGPDVTLTNNGDGTVTMANGIVTAVIGISGSQILRFTYNGIQVTDGGTAGNSAFYWKGGDQIGNEETGSSGILSIITDPSSNGGDYAEILQFKDKLTGSLAPIYWATIVLNVLAPQLMWSQKMRLDPRVILPVCFGVIVGMWCERYQIVVMSLRRTHLPSAWGDYVPTVWDWLTLFGTVGLFLLGILLAVRYLPVISMFEMRELIQRRAGEGEGSGSVARNDSSS